MMVFSDYRCYKCGKVYTWLQNLKYHIRFECGLPPSQQCPYCPYKSKRKGNMTRHIKSKHLSFIILSWIKLQTFFNFRFPTKSLLLRIYIIYAYLDVSDVLKISFWEHLHMLLKEKFWYKFECAISLIIIYL